MTAPEHSDARAMPPFLQHLATAQGGVFTRRQAVHAGCSEREIKTRTGARGDWIVVHRGVYCERWRWERADAIERHALRVAATALVATAPSVSSHGSAAVALRMPTRPRWLELVHVTRPDVLGGRVEGGVKHHRGWTDSDVLQDGHLWLTAPARTAMDIGREHGFEDGVVAADAAMRLGATDADFARVLDRMTYWPGVTQARAAAAVADKGAETVGETLTRLLVLELGIGRPETQFCVQSEGRTAWVDLKLHRHFVEFDGKVKYLGREDGGVAEKSPAQVVWEEKQREDWLRRYDGGHGVSRVIWSELMPAERERTKRRLLQEYMTSLTLYGHLDH